MAALEELEAVVLREDGSDTDVPAPAQGKVKKVALVAGLCLAAVFVGAAVIKPGVQGDMPRAAAPVWGFTVLSTSREHEFKNMSEQCVSELKDLEEEYKDAEKAHEAQGHDLECDDDDMVCKATFGTDEWGKMSKCFPTACQEKNIEAELNNDDDKPPGVSKVSVSCSQGGGGSNSGSGSSSSEYEFQHLQPKCQKALKKLEEKYQSAGKEYETDGHDLTCDEDDKFCKLRMKKDGDVQKMSKCFPKVCKTKNIRKEAKNAFEPDKIRVFCQKVESL
jgi:hypothetical protein